MDDNLRVTLHAIKLFQDEMRRLWAGLGLLVIVTTLLCFLCVPGLLPSGGDGSEELLQRRGDLTLARQEEGALSARIKQLQRIKAMLGSKVSVVEPFEGMHGIRENCSCVSERVSLAVYFCSHRCFVG